MVNPPSLNYIYKLQGLQVNALNNTTSHFKLIALKVFSANYMKKKLRNIVQFSYLNSLVVFHSMSDRPVCKQKNHDEVACVTFEIPVLMNSIQSQRRLETWHQVEKA